MVTYGLLIAGGVENTSFTGRYLFTAGFALFCKVRELCVLDTLQKVGTEFWALFGPLYRRWALYFRHLLTHTTGDGIVFCAIFGPYYN